MAFLLHSDMDLGLICTDTFDGRRSGSKICKMRILTSNTESTSWAHANQGGLTSDVAENAMEIRVLFLDGISFFIKSNSFCPECSAIQWT